MPQCHQCEHRDDPALRGLPYEQTPCAKCQPVESHHGATHVSIDADPAVENIEIRATIDVGELIGEDCFTRDELREGLKPLLHLMCENPITAKIVLFRICYPDVSLQEIGTHVNMSKVAVHKRLRQACVQWPELRRAI